MSFLVTIRLPHDACIAVSFAHGASASVRDLKLAAFQAIGPTPDGCEDSFTLDGEGRGSLSALTTDAQTFDDAGISNEATVTVTRRRECCSICVHHSASPVCVCMHRVFTCARLCAPISQGARNGTALAVKPCLRVKNTLCSGPSAVDGCCVIRACPTPLQRTCAGTALGRTRVILALPLKLYRPATSAMRLWRNT